MPVGSEQAKAGLTINSGLPAMSRAAVLSAYRQPVEVREIEIPEVEADAIVVAVEASTMCGTDVHIVDGHYESTPLPKLPIILGHEIIGRVVALGPERRTDSLNRPLGEGDLVAWAYPWCDRCYWCTIAKQPSLCENWRGYGWGPADQHPYLTGGFSEYCYVLPHCKVLKVPANIDPAVAASATCAFRTVVHGFEAAGGVRINETVVIQGSGPVGLYALAYAIETGAAQAICIGAPAERLAIANRWGAVRTLDIGSTDLVERKSVVQELTEGRGADLVVECTGVADAFEEGFDLVRRGGRYLVLGQSDPRASKVHGTHINLRQLTVLGTVSADVSHYYGALRFIADHGEKYDFDALISKRYGLNEVDDALDAMRDHRETKPVIVPSLARS